MMCRQALQMLAVAENVITSVLERFQGLHGTVSDSLDLCEPSQQKGTVSQSPACDILVSFQHVVDAVDRLALDASTLLHDK